MCVCLLCCSGEYERDIFNEKPSKEEQLNATEVCSICTYIIYLCIIHIYVCTTYIHVCTHVHTHMHRYTHMYMLAYTCICTLGIHIHTYICTVQFLQGSVAKRVAETATIHTSVGDIQIKLFMEQ